MSVKLNRLGVVVSAVRTRSDYSNFSLSEPQAFRKIQRMSMEQNRKMAEVAEAFLVVYGPK